MHPVVSLKYMVADLFGAERGITRRSYECMLRECV